MNDDRRWTENREDHLNIGVKLDAIHDILRVQPQECAKTFTYNKTFWKVVGVIFTIFTLYGGAIAYTIKMHIR